ncbi:helix-turn-helix domain-containing protein [Sporosarcina sp. Sa2YVA2]|uniref:Helix-turn-helix domain-containing protein n=1 Tax=Sporosarcina quadrami TaxID=2762234 RepID=A0ABR8UCJ6_9BACL|nr:Rgg/GadR/MutR family transcriptional regulator [Sporosarcina quadrami]MBD7985757.1 helix-turn-helix domain-containing protein [Sporosarcina quadrami]
MKAYGETLRQIREQKGLTLKELADGICSISFLSKFERSDSDITLRLFTRVLDKLMMSFDEFLFVHNEFKAGQLERFFKAIGNAYNQNDSDALRKLKEQEKKKWKQSGLEMYKHHVLMLQMYESIIDNKAMVEEVHKEDIQRLADYFFNVEVWGQYEFMLYNATMLFLDADMVLQLSRTAYEKSIRYEEFQKVNEVTGTILMNTIIYLLGPVNKFTNEMKFQAELGEFFSYLNALSVPEHKLFERATLLQLKGAYKLRIGESELGTAMIQKAIHIYTELGAVGQANHIENYLEQIMAYQETDS